MKQVSMWRVIFILLITAGCLWVFYPTLRYLTVLDNPDYPKEKKEELRENAISLGLDLRGGVDVSLKIDRTQVMVDTAASQVTTLKNEFANKQISASAQVSDTPGTIIAQALDVADARNIANTLADYDEVLQGIPDQATVASGQPFELQVRSDYVDRELEKNIKGAERIVRERLDKFGLSQPSISIENNERIRVQVPGEGDPDVLIENLTSMAAMEFRIAHPQTDQLIAQYIDPITEEIRPEAIVPLGYEILPSKFGRTDETTQQVVFDKGHMLVEREKKITGESLRNTGVVQDLMDFQNPNKVSIQFDDEGSDLFEEITGSSAAKPQHDRLAVILDGVVITAPQMSVRIPGGNAVIEGGFSLNEAQDLSRLLKAGSLPAPLVPESKQSVGPSLGTESIFSGVKALAFGTLAVVIFMVFYYGMAGIISIFALILNVLIILAILALSNATLTLAGIGGILLTIGMAVDANVLIYERIREEIDSGRPLKQAISVGFDRAFTVILDSNLTTLMTALVLLQFTKGSVFGFALTMTFGLIANLYTGLTVTKTLCVVWFQWRNKLSLGSLRLFHKPTFDFIKARFGSSIFSATLLVLGLGVVFASGGLRFGVDFAGGLRTTVRFVDDTNEDAVRAMLADAGLTGERVQRISGTNDFIIRVAELELTEEQIAEIGVLQATENKLREALTSHYGEGHDGVEGDSVAAGAWEIRDLVSFGPETGQAFRNMAITVIILASIAILLYLWFRFELVFGIAAVIALIHDLLITVTWSTIWGVEISLDAVAALMVLLGFSVNDTIVVFDRIRENARKEQGKSFKEICNLSMNQSLSRTVITSGTAILVITVMLVIGGEGLKPFAKILLIGSVIGTYSSSFVAAPIVYQWNERRKNQVQKALAAKTTIGPERAQDPALRDTPKSSKKKSTGTTSEKAAARKAKREKGGMKRI